ncbi:efflux RND transporter permease subunit [Halodesulfovibrio marinisediminis]|uniref:Hydrophobic/amphiphilic exporter-1, HAE1 family n=1 Tax=Halodesulfovibrio marinisediminis DSM 17456 TaxID=1121457 RepID=A0A1N6GVD2_9BACT|nr:multidrug efflux RND transporter permease subunit [Halodesulfovibrio marinisediminis]SIO11407.1 hydrophobic/amphiphilic exporter-1, HAE1 family [Halodesulfovibrio marinisediminis DSM 17456]
MTISHFFIDRPKFAIVISLVITLVGGLAILTLPIAQYPDITPPVVTVTATFPGASPEILERTVIKPLEDNINGVENMIYISSSADTTGTATTTITFAPGSDPDMAQVNVQNRVSQADPNLPEQVRRLGVTVNKQSPTMLLGVSIISPDNSYSSLFLNNYAKQFIVDPLKRIHGVSDVQIFGSPYSMRIWLDPKLMESYRMTTSDVQDALQQQNIIVAAGSIGGGPNVEQQQFRYTVQAQGRLITAEEFNNIILRATSDGAIVRVKDIGHAELGDESYDFNAKLNNKPQAFVVVYQTSDGNALEIAQNIYKRMEVLSQQFPKGIDYLIPYDTTIFIKRSIDEVVETLFQAVCLVVLVVFLFLQNVRATFIPTVAIPVSLVGTFAVMQALGYSINTISLFGLVLAIGVVVDDAIVVIENVERHITESKLPPKEAARIAMSEVTSPIIATTLVLLAVFVPVMFMPGITGGLYKQFAVTITVSVLISSVNALTLSPALCSLLLKEGQLEPISFLRPIDRAIKWSTERYGTIITTILRKGLLTLVAIIVIFSATGYLYKTTPTAFIPNEDQGFFFVDAQLPEASSMNRTQRVLEEVTDMTQKVSGVERVITVAGRSFLSGNLSNTGLIIVMLEDWDSRPDGKTLRDIMAEANKLYRNYPNASLRSFELPAIPGIGTTGGFAYQLQDTLSRPPENIAKVAQQLSMKATQDPAVLFAYTTFRTDVPQYFLEVDRNKAMVMGISLGDIYATLQAQFGSLYVNDFVRQGQIYQVNIQADAKYRAKPEDFWLFYVRNGKGEMVPISSVASITPILGPAQVFHYNLYSTVAINGNAAPGYSSGDAIATMERLSNELPPGYTFEWTALSLQEIEAGNLAPLIFLLSFTFVYLFLVAQYESWVMPVAIVGAVPLAIFGAIAGTHYWAPLFELNNNIYAQIGVVLLIGMAAKTSILIVEFSMDLYKEGKSAEEAAFMAAKIRFRAVLMTAFSFVLGVSPLVVASGPGSASRHSLGIAVMCGMITATVFAPLLVPGFYYHLQRLLEFFERKMKTRADAAAKKVKEKS